MLRLLLLLFHCVCRNQTTLQIRSTHEDTVRRQICCLSRASGVKVVIYFWAMVSVVFRLVRCRLFCSSGFWLRRFVARCWSSVGVFAVVPLGVSCSLSCRVGGTDTLWPVRALGRRPVVPSRHSAASGRRGMRARLVCWRSGASGMGANAVDDIFLSVFKISARS